MLTKILYFFSCIISPIRVRNLKKMSIFIALLIFLLEFWILFLPSRSYIVKHKEVTASVYDYTYALYNLKDTGNGTEYKKIQNNSYKIVDGTIVASSNDITILTYLYYYQEENICVYMVFDPTDQLDEAITLVKNEYHALYPNEGAEDATVNAICLLSYKDSLSEDTVTNYESLIKKYHAMDSETLSDLVNDIPTYAYYGIKPLASNKNYGYVFSKDSVIRSIEDGETNVFGYSRLSIDSKNYETIESFSKEISLQMIDAYNETLVNLLVLYDILVTILFPILACLILYLFTRKHKQLESILEYYKIESLLSILPALVSSIFAIFIGPNARNIYLVLFIVYTLIMLFKAATHESEKEEESK